MDDKEMITAFEQIVRCADSEAVEKKVRDKTANKTVKRVVKHRSALIAAAVFLLVLAIPVAAFGSVFIYSAISTGNGFAIDVKGNFTPVQFTAEMTKQLKNYRIFSGGNGYSANVYETGRVFANYDELAEWLDCGLLDSEMLGDKSGKGLALFSIVDKFDRLNNVHVSGRADIVGTDHYVMINLSLPQSYFEYTTGWKTVGSDMVSSQKYTTPSGIETQIVVTSTDYAKIFFINGGVQYSFMMFSSNFGGDMDACVEMLKELADSFE